MATASQHSNLLNKITRRINHAPMVIRRRLSERATWFRNEHSKLVPAKKTYYPNGFIGDNSLDLTQHLYVHNSLFPKTDIRAWLDRDDAMEQIDAKLNAGELTEEQAEACRQFSQYGFYIAKGLFSREEVDQTFESYQRAINAKSIKLNSNRRILNPHQSAPQLDKMIRDARIMDLNRLFLGESGIIPFQSIGSHYGSEQLEHSDAIHMTTYPLGYLVACWVSCDDVTKGSGELMYYPGSHKLPYQLSDQVGFHPTEYGEKGRKHVYHELYEPHMQKWVKENNIERHYFYPEKGDALFWHHNLIHGGSPITDQSLTRRAFVFHYYAKRVVRYHELFGGLADIRF